VFAHLAPGLKAGAVVVPIRQPLVQT